MLASKIKSIALNRLVCATAATMILVACASSDGMPATGSAGRPVYLRAMKTQLATPRAAIGPLYAGPHCVPQGEVIWDDGLFRQLSHQLPKIFRRDLQRAHYRVPPASDPEMTTLDTAPPDYAEVDMQVQEVSARLCKQDSGTSGGVRMKVFWQVYAAGTSTPLYETVTQGSFEVPAPETRTDAEFFAQAFSAALNELLAQDEFREALMQVHTR